MNATRSLLASRQAQEKAAVGERQQLERAALRREGGRFPSYEDWLASRDRDQADQWRHRDRRPAIIEGATFEQPAAWDIRAFTAVIDGRKVGLRLVGSRRAGRPERGPGIAIHAAGTRGSGDGRRPAQRPEVGTAPVHGNQEVIRIGVELAAERGFKMADGGPSARDRRGAPTAPAKRRARHSRGWRGGSSGSLTLSSIYRRHIEEILHEQPHARRFDASRLDADVAIRMVLTGHSREQIGKAILDGARRDRPDENRDWQAYARRAVQPPSVPLERKRAYALSPSGTSSCALKVRDEDERDLLRRLGGPLPGF